MPQVDPRVGARIRRRRKELGLSLSRLAELAGVSKGYLSSLENESGQHRSRPSGQTLYRIAEALGVTMSDLLGRRLLIEAPTNVPPSLEAFAAEAGLAESDVAMLASVNFRGQQPTDKESWAFIWRAIRASVEPGRE